MRKGVKLYKIEIKYILLMYIFKEISKISMISLRNLCTPAYVYFVISMISVLVIYIQNYNLSENIYCLGQYSCQLSKTSTALMFVFKIIYILFWTWILNLMCGAGYRYIAWIFVLLPIVLFFILILLFMFTPISL
jgi:hypothetical protein